MLRLLCRTSFALGPLLLLAAMGFGPSGRARAGYPQRNGAGTESAADRKRLHDEAFTILGSPVSYEGEAWAAAQARIRRAREIFARLCGPDDWRTRLATHTIAQIETDAKLGQAGRTRLETMGLRHLQATLHSRSGRFRDALKCAEEARSICEEILGKEEPRYWNFLQSLATIHRRLGDYDKAREFYEQAQGAAELAFGPVSPNSALIRSELASSYVEQGLYDQAALQFAQTGEGWRQLVDDEFFRADPRGNHYALFCRGYGVFLNNRGLFNLASGDYETADTWFQQAATIFQESGDDSARAITLSNLAGLYRDSNQGTKARRTYRQAYDLHSKIHKGHFYTTVTLGRLARIHFDLKEIDEGKRWLSELESSLKQPLSGKSPALLGGCLVDLAHCYMHLGRREQARAAFRAARAVAMQHLGGRDPVSYACLLGLATLHEADGELAAAKGLLEEATEMARSSMENAPRSLGIRKRLGLLEHFRSALDRYLTVALSADAPPQDLYNQAIAWKGIVGTQRSWAQRVGDDPKSRCLLDELHTVHARLSHLWHAVPGLDDVDAQLGDIERLTIKKEELEAQIVALSPAAHRERELSHLDSCRVAHALPAGTALIDFVTYIHRGPSGAESRVLAFIVHPDRDVALVELGHETDLQEKICAWREALAKRDSMSLQPASEALVAQIWDPFRPHLDGVTGVTVCPDGPLSLLPFGALPGSRADSFLIEDMPIGYVTSARSVVEGTGPPSAASPGLLAVGGIDYDADIHPDRTDPGTETLAPTRAESLPPPKDALPGTELEARRSVELFRQAFPADAHRVKLLTGMEPDERRLKRELDKGREGGWPHILLASHGAFSIPKWLRDEPNPLDSTPDALEKMHAVRLGRMFFSGLALAGFNRPHGGGEDEVLTADEVNGLDLSRTELTVLTGCEAGLGLPVSGEGLLGMRYAFHAAGTRGVMAALWPVVDHETAKLIEQFYINLFNKRMTPQDALRHAQVRMLRTGAGESPHPYYWAGFVLSGVPARSSAPLPEVFVPTPGGDESRESVGRPPSRAYGPALALLAAAGFAVALSIWALGALRRRRPPAGHL